MRISTIIMVAVLATAGLAQAQSSGPVLRPVQIQRPVTTPQTASPTDAGRYTGDPVGQLQSRVNKLSKKVHGLEGRVATLEEMLRQTQAATSFKCVNDTTSMNGSGRTEDCGPYACNYMDGRCRTSAVNSMGCSSGYQWVSGNQCIALPPGGEE